MASRRREVGAATAAGCALAAARRGIGSLAAPSRAAEERTGTAAFSRTGTAIGGLTGTMMGSRAGIAPDDAGSISRRAIGRCEGSGSGCSRRAARSMTRGTLVLLGTRDALGLCRGMATSRRCRESSSSEGGSVNATEREEATSLSIPVRSGFCTAVRSDSDGSGPESPSLSLGSKGALCMMLSIPHVGHEVTPAYLTVKFRGRRLCSSWITSSLSLVKTANLWLGGCYRAPHAACSRPHGVSEPASGTQDFV